METCMLRHKCQTPLKNLVFVVKLFLHFFTIKFIMFKSKSQTYVTEKYIIAICQGSKSLSYHLSLLDQIAIRYYQHLMYCPFTMHVNHVKPKTFCYSVRIV